MEDLDVFLEVQGTGQLLGVDEDPVGVAGGLLPLAEQHRAEAHGQVLTRHLIHLLVRRHQLQMVQQLPECYLRKPWAMSAHTHTLS